MPGHVYKAGNRTSCIIIIIIINNWKVGNSNNSRWTDLQAGCSYAAVSLSASRDSWAAAGRDGSLALHCHWIQTHKIISLHTATDITNVEQRNFSILRVVFISDVYVNNNGNKAFIDIRHRPGLAMPRGALHFTTLSPWQLIRTTTAKHDVLHKTESTQSSAMPQGICITHFMKIGPEVPEICSRTPDRLGRSN